MWPWYWRRKNKGLAHLPLPFILYPDKSLSLPPLTFHSHQPFIILTTYIQLLAIADIGKSIFEGKIIIYSLAWPHLLLFGPGSSVTLPESNYKNKWDLIWLKNIFNEIGKLNLTADNKTKYRSFQTFTRSKKVAKHTVNIFWSYAL